MKLIQLNDGLQVWQSTKPTRDHSFIPDMDLAEHCPEFWHKCYDVLSNDAYALAQQAFVSNVMEFYDDWSYITWKQYDSIMGLYIPPKRTRMQVAALNRTYIKARTASMLDTGLLTFLHHVDAKMMDSIVDHMDEDDLIGRFLPTEEAMEGMWLNVATAGSFY